MWGEQTFRDPATLRRPALHAASPIARRCADLDNQLANTAVGHQTLQFWTGTQASLSGHPIRRVGIISPWSEVISRRPIGARVK